MFRETGDVRISFLCLASLSLYLSLSLFVNYPRKLERTCNKPGLFNLDLVDRYGDACEYNTSLTTTSRRYGETFDYQRTCHVRNDNERWKTFHCFLSISLIQSLLPHLSLKFRPCDYSTYMHYKALSSSNGRKGIVSSSSMTHKVPDDPWEMVGIDSFTSHCIWTISYIMYTICVIRLFWQVTVTRDGKPTGGVYYWNKTTNVTTAIGGEMTFTKVIMLYLTQILTLTLLSSFHTFT